jgi:ATP-dependent Lhr-like helicase
LESEGFVTKGYFIQDDPTLMWMLTEDVGKRPRRFSEKFVLNTQDNLHIYLRDMLKKEVGSTKSVVFSGVRVIGSFKGKVSPSGTKVEDFEGSDMAYRTIKEAAQSVGASIETPVQREDDEWDICTMTTKLNLGL